MLTATVTLLIFCTVLSNSGLAWPNAGLALSLEDAEQHFEKFIQDFDKQYTEEEKVLRFEIFKENLKKIIEKNNDPEETANFGISKFADLTVEEFKAKYTGFRPSKGRVDFRSDLDKFGEEELPVNFDWRQYNIVTRVKDQNFCNSCWTFSTTGTVEGAYALKHKKLVELSEQQLLNCARPGDRGCGDGGRMDEALEYLKNAGGLESEQDYPYTMEPDMCKFNERKVKVHVTGYQVYNSTDEETLKRILYNTGPLALGIDASDVQHHPNGILKKCSSVNLNHGVLLVGYGEENGLPYWLLKNSWGEEWGERGYFRIERGINACGIIDDVACMAEVA